MKTTCEVHWKCSCGVWNHPSTATCVACGKPQPVSKSAKAMPTSTVCPSCRRNIPNLPVCPSCGGKVRRRTTQEAAVERQRQINEYAAELSACTSPRQAGEICGQMAALYYKGHDPARALWCAQQAVAADEYNTPAWCYYMGSLCMLGRRKEAKEIYRTIPRLPDRAKTQIVASWLL